MSMSQQAIMVLPGNVGGIAPYEPGQSIRKNSRVAYIAMAVLGVVFLLGAGVVPIGGAVIGSGRLGVESRVKRIAHPTGGVVSQILVKDGAHVRRGQVLIRLDNDVGSLSLDLTGQSVEQLLAQKARLEAQRDGMPAIAFPEALTRRNSESARAAMASQQRLFELQRMEQAGTQAQLQERIKQLNEQISGYRAQIASVQRQQALIEPERRGVQELWEKKLVTINRMNQLERSAADLSGSLGSLQAQIAQSQGRIAETREQVITLQQTARSQAGSELAQVMSALADQQIRNVSAGEVSDRSTIRAPYDGVVDKLDISSVGDVITPAVTIMEIVPDRDRLVVEASINPADVDRVYAGQEARVRFSLLSTQATPDIAGTVSFVSAESVTQKETGVSYYRIRITLDGGALTKERLALKPGMPAEVFIATGSRSMLSYLTKPFQDQFARAFRR
jgi:HlyD family type I secretion membrane fusion protein